MNSHPNNEEEVFDCAAALVPGERSDFLDKACHRDAALRKRIEKLLQAHDAAADFLIPPRTLAVKFPDEVPGDHIGRYKILQRIGEGGCGVVYMAEQTEPIRRKVALKIIKLGMDTKAVIARFEAERQALALMDHPNIAKVLDAGATETGRPYFVMELVRGAKITDYCDQNQLSTSDRLKLFTQVCSAIQHAHQKGIIHRDIKPSNILVTLHDAAPTPKVIDFGIAKATQGSLTDKTLFTAFEQFIGTPAYMSPEQAQFTDQDIDTRSDIYSMGVLLYELLTGHTPFETSDLWRAGLDELRRVIREQEPAKPSTRLHSLQRATLTTVATHRQSEPPKLIKQVRGDLDCIVMKCLEKDRTRRYGNVSTIAADVERYLRNEPIEARPTGSAYRYAKFVRRHKVAFASATVVTLVAIIALVAIVRDLTAERVVRQLRLADDKLRSAQTSQNYNLWYEGIAILRRTLPAGDKELIFNLTRFARFLDGRQRYDEALDTYREACATPPATPCSEYAMAMHHLAKSLYDHHKIEEARELAKKAIDLYAGHPDWPVNEYGHALNVWIEAHGEENRTPDLEAAYRQTLLIDRSRRNYEPLQWQAEVDRLGRFLVKQGRTPELETVYRDFLQEHHDKETDAASKREFIDRVTDCDSRFGEQAAQLGLWRESIKDFTDAIALTPSDPYPWCRLGTALLASGDHTAYESLRRDMLARFQNLTDASLARELIVTASLLPLSDQIEFQQLAKISDAAGTLDDAGAATYLARGIAEFRANHFAAANDWLDKIRNPSDPMRNALTLSCKAMATYRLSDKSSALTLLVSAKSILQPIDHEDIEKSKAMQNWLDYVTTRIFFHEAQSLIEGAASPMPLFTDNSALTQNERARYFSKRGDAFFDKHKYADAEACYREWLRRLRVYVGEGDFRIEVALVALVNSLLSQNKFADAEPFARQCAKLRHNSTPGKWPDYSAQSLLGGALAGQNRFKEAEPVLLAAYDGLIAHRAAIPPQARWCVGQTASRLAKMYQAMGDTTRAAQWEAKAAATN